MQMLILQFFLLTSLLLPEAQINGQMRASREAREIDPNQQLDKISASQQEDEANEVEVVVISPIGFEPKEITRPKGAFILDVVNLSGLDQLNVEVTIDSANGQNPAEKPVYSGTVSLDRQDWNVKANVPPGRYQIVEANHPNDLNWILTVNIQ